ncbi:MAG: LON peptidase substrate-binding domain-containing protein [Pelobium sp.]
MNLPIFPLKLIVFPGEQVNLHVFEERYRELFNDLRSDENLFFGIPPVINNEIHPVGTRLKLLQIVKEYESGEMDVITEGMDVFTIEDLQTNFVNKTYAGAKVELMEDDPAYDIIKFEQLQDHYEEFQSLLTQRKEIKNVNPNKYSFQIAHYSGLSEEQKIALLATPSENERQEIMIAHFKKIMPSMQHIQETQRRIVANGHFKNLHSFNFNKPG